LSVARDLGAKTYFVDRDIFITVYNINNGHECFPMDYFKPELPNIGRYDLVLSRGSLNVDMMNRTNFDIDNLLNWIVSLGEKVIIIPTWDKGELVRGEDYTCEGEHLYSYLKSMVHESFLAHGFGFVVDQENLRFPITYKNF